VEQASQEIAARRGSDEFSIALSRLADIENKGTLPGIFRLYTLCAIYRLDFAEVMRWYGVNLDNLPSEVVQIQLNETHVVEFGAGRGIPCPAPPDVEIDLTRTSFLSHILRRWGKTPLTFLHGVDLNKHRYGFIGLEDWSMYPLLYPGALVVIDESRRKIAQSGWTNEFDRPIYFLEHRDGYMCGWCSLHEGTLLVQPHPASQQRPTAFAFQTEIDVLGQVTGVAMRLDPKRRRHSRAAAAPEASLNP